MKESELAALQALKIPVWVSQDRPMETSHPKEEHKPYLCVLDKQEWQNPQLQALFNNIMQALNWSERAYDVVLYEPGIKKLEPEHYEVIVVFGNQFAPSFTCLQVASLSNMQASTQAKRVTWQSLKPYVLA